MDTSFWRERKVLMTGHTGFKGSWLTLWLQSLGAHVTGVALPCETSPHLFDLLALENDIDHHFCDIRDDCKLSGIVSVAQPDVIFHMAAQPLVREGYRDPSKTFSTNMMGTVHILETLRSLEKKFAVVVVTTDKVYENQEWCWPYRESDQLGGHDPYSASKACCEMIVASYRKSFFSSPHIGLASARAGNVIGGGDWAKDRLIPDAVRAWGCRKSLQVRSPQSTRPWQHVLEPLHGYITLAEKIWKDPLAGEAFNLGPTSASQRTVRDVLEILRIFYKDAVIEYVDSEFHEAGFLALDSQKAQSLLNIVPRWDFEDTVKRTAKWYLEYDQGADARSLCLRDIDQYREDMSRGE